MKQKKILRIISTLKNTIGGTARIAIDQSNELVKRGFNIDVLTLDRKHYHKSEKFFFNLINLETNKNKNIFSITFFIWVIKNWKKYDLFLIDGIWEFSTIIARIFFRKKYFVFLHGQIDPYFSLEFFKKIKKKIYWYFIEKKNLINSKFVILSGNTEKKMFNNTFVDTNNIPYKTINYGITNFKFVNLKKTKKRINKKYQNILDKKYLLFIGRIHPKKGCDVLIKSLDKLDLPDDYYIIFAGFLSNNNSYENYILNLIKKSRYANRILCLPFQDRDNKFALIKFSKCTVLPSRGENFGISVVETLMMSRVAILTDKVGIHQIVKKENSGIITKCNSYSLSKSLEFFFKMSYKNKVRLEKNAKNCYQTKFSINTTINDLEKIILKYFNYS